MVHRVSLQAYEVTVGKLLFKGTDFNLEENLKMRKILAVVLMSLISVVAVNAKPIARKSTVRASAAAGKVTVTVTSFQFTPKTVTVAVGTTVVWFNKEGRHTIEADKGEFKSDVLTDG